MPGFDVLDPQLDLKKSYFLEASAGTGKTFTIENIVVRLLEEGVSVNRILVVTFTRAATLELKMRIRKRLEEKGMLFTLAAFDEAQIFTIHGFCFQTLKEHAFDTGFSLSQTDEAGSPDVYNRILKDFLRTGLSLEEIHPKQLQKVIGKRGFPHFLKSLSKPISERGRSYHDIAEEADQFIKNLMWKPSLEELVEMASSFKGFCDIKGNVKPDRVEDLRRCVSLVNGDKESLVDLPLMTMTPDNLKQKKSYPEKLNIFCERLISLIKEASDTSLILSRLADRAKQYLNHVCERDDIFFYDDLLKLMQQNVRNPAFAASVRKGYDAVLIDEFQDTDPVQWEIFSTLFLNYLPLYLVGDPKQSIYRFRGADLYAYMAAKTALGDEAYATLTRNFRSQPSLIQGLNTLFARAGDLITLAKTGQSISILPVTPGLTQTHEGKITFCVTDNQDTLFSWTYAEIERLKREHGVPYRSCAVLVKDRYQAKKFCDDSPLPCSTQRSESLLDADAFPVLEDLLLAVFNPRERRHVIKALGGPLFRCPAENLAEGLETRVEPLYRYHELLVTKGILSFFHTLSEELSFPSQGLYLDLWQLVEMVAENTTGSEEYLPYLQKLRRDDPDSDHLKTRAKCTEDAVQVMTLHVSKGLEFEATFPVGLMKEADMEDGEDLSEKMRQLYVALTRAKRYLYLPLVADTPQTPMNYFMSKVLQGDSLETFTAQHPHFSHVTCHKQNTIPVASPPTQPRQTASVPAFSFPSFGIYSYSSLTPHYVPETFLQIPSSQMPAGSETGTLLHTVFEKLDFSLRGDELRMYVQQAISNTPLEPWLESVVAIVHHALHARLKGPKGSFCLADVNPKHMMREMEFLFPSSTPAGFIKGFIDLFFEHNGYYYCLDWKSNFLSNYSPSSLQAAISAHNYGLQAELYHSAAQKYLKLFQQEGSFEGSFYLFLRGLSAETSNGIHFFSNKGDKNV